MSILELIPKRPRTWNDGPIGPPTTRKPRDPQAIERLHAQYAAYRETGIGRRVDPWTCQAALALGRIFMAAYGIVPPANRLCSAYSMPESSSIRRLFGTLQVYYVALQEGEAP